MPQVIEAIYYAVDRGFKLPIVYNTSSYDSVKSIELLDGLVGELGGQIFFSLFICITLIFYCRRIPTGFQILACSYKSTLVQSSRLS